MKILIMGAYGMLGHKLYEKLSSQFKTYATCRAIRREETWTWPFSEGHLIPDVQAEDFDSILRAINKVRPDVIINCIGIIKQLDAAKDSIRSIGINALFPHRLNLACQAGGVRLIHFSTDCVFSGKKGNYTEKDTSDAEDLYGRTKYLGEVDGEGALTIRSSIIGWELGTRSGLVEWFYGQRGKRIRGYRNAIYTGFTTSAMSEIVARIIMNHPDLSGTWQVASQPISKYDLLQKLNGMMALGVAIEPDEEFRCDRSLNGAAFAEKTGFVSPSWDVMLSELAEEKKLYKGKV